MPKRTSPRVTREEREHPTRIHRERWQLWRGEAGGGSPQRGAHSLEWYFLGYWTVGISSLEEVANITPELRVDQAIDRHRGGDRGGTLASPGPRRQEPRAGLGLVVLAGAWGGGGIGLGPGAAALVLGLVGGGLGAGAQSCPTASCSGPDDKLLEGDGPSGGGGRRPTGSCGGCRCWAALLRGGAGRAGDGQFRTRMRPLGGRAPATAQQQGIPPVGWVERRGPEETSHGRGHCRAPRRRGIRPPDRHSHQACWQGWPGPSRQGGGEPGKAALANRRQVLRCRVKRRARLNCHEITLGSRLKAHRGWWPPDGGDPI
ncbi:hypothetical protein H696_01252 [Fonticula alba]|uniref:Uncharacterized protein n=1 Tax=Fonticula alba TaxID=691883 RepID=A0A058ZD25_FONAL|nr:hypothetical protein H696_01252 [Fonticula alba]KCV71833.1 hypothetical protein H696_01252 [Fonticula alba]|eukprot:XP_009493411.1 hypothetical protein H696_01252 [Fonticula alba]